MKAERRHELKENDLVHALEVTKVYLQQNGRSLGLVLVGLIAIVVVVSLSVRSRAANLEEAWKRKSLLTFATPEESRQSLDQLAGMIESSGDQSFVLSGLIDLGAQSLRLAQQSPAPPDPDFNKRARGAFEKLLARFGDNPLAFGTAHLGLATVEENSFALDRASGARDRAQAHLNAVLQNPALSTLPHSKMASERLAALDTTFRIVQFADAPPPPAPVQPAPVQLQRVQITPDGAVEAVDIEAQPSTDEVDPAVEQDEDADADTDEAP